MPGVPSQTKGVVYPREDNAGYDGDDSDCRGPDSSFLVVLIRKEVNPMRLWNTKATPKPDDPCPCGSGKPYKDCCGKGQ